MNKKQLIFATGSHDATFSCRQGFRATTCARPKAILGKRKMTQGVSEFNRGRAPVMGAKIVRISKACPPTFAIMIGEPANSCGGFCGRQLSKEGFALVGKEKDE